MKILPTYISKVKFDFEKKVILLMTPNKEKEGWHNIKTPR